MIHRFVPEVLKVPEPEVEFIHERGHYVTNIKLPEPDPEDRIVEEYDDDQFE